VPAGDVIFLALADEEALGANGAGWLVSEHSELFAGVRFAIGEFGGFTLYAGGRRFYPVQVAEKQICTVHATVRGAGGHGSMPVRGGAPAKLARMLERLDRRRLPLHVVPVVRRMVEDIANALPRAQRIALRGMLRPSVSDRLIDRMGSRARLFDASLHNTVSATMIETTKSFNVIPSEIKVTLDGRLLPGHSPEDLLRELRPLVGEDVELEVVRHDPGPAGPDMALFPVLSEILREADPGAAAVTPLLMPGVTDGRFFSRLGIQTYGFLPLRLPPGFDFWSTVHAADERVPVEALSFGADAIYRALERFGTAT
jgi:acetylornithine deacetylase/succinyl-diaminopimelate desuccinylase-like protein